MKHHIIVKWKEGKQPSVDTRKSIEELFQKALEIPGIEEISFYDSVIFRPNRYDLMIVVKMAKEALPQFDASRVHTDWKERYGDCIEAKAIFDCE